MGCKKIKKVDGAITKGTVRGGGGCKSKGDLFDCNEWNPEWCARPEGEFERGASRTKSGHIFINFVKFWAILGKICTSQTFDKVNTKECFLISFVTVVFPCIIFDYIFEVILSSNLMRLRRFIVKYNAFLHFFRKIGQISICNFILPMIDLHNQTFKTYWLSRCKYFSKILQIYLTIY